MLKHQVGLLSLMAASLVGACVSDISDSSDPAEQDLGASEQPTATDVMPAGPAVVASPGAMKPRLRPVKPAASVPSPHLLPDEIVVKFKEGTRVRLRAGALRFEDGALAQTERTLLARQGLASTRVASDVSAANALLAGAGLERLFDRDEAELERDKARGEANRAEELADLNLYFGVRVDPAAQAALIDRLNAIDSVELAYAPPMPEDAAIDAPPVTGSYTASQDYVNAAPVGIDARYARTVQGGAGLGVKVIDIENGWHSEHEDAPPIFTTSGEVGISNHGTAVMGVIAAVENGYGMTGAASDVKFGVAAVKNKAPGATTATRSVARAVNTAAASLSAGDVILIEQHGKGPDSGLTCTCNCDQFEYVAMENWQAEFDAMQAATALGINVVEAAGNGSMNLDAPIYGGRFDRAQRDSGAIIVGAGTSNGGRAAQCWTNHGSRVDLQGWGDSVATLGYGTLAKLNGEDANQWYASGFSGTSSASPIVVSAVAAVQGARIAHGHGVATPSAMRSLLVTTGTAQVGTKQIGPLPNLRLALGALGIRPTTSFVWTATAETRIGNWTVIDHPATNERPNAVLQVTHSWGSAEVGVADDHTLSVYYANGRWAILHQDLTVIPLNAMYNVVVNDGFVHRASPENTSGHFTKIDNPYANGNPSAVLIVTPSFNPGGGNGVYNNHPTGVWYDGSRWNIYNEDLAPMPANARFNVEVSPYGSFRQTAATPSGNMTYLATSLAAPAGAHVLVTHNFGPYAKYNTRQTGVFYGDGLWAVYNEDASPMLQFATFNAFVANAPRATW